MKISVSNDMTFIWSTKLHLFLYRLRAALKSTEKKNEMLVNQTETTRNNIQFEIDACAHVYIQLSTDCRYIENFFFTYRFPFCLFFPIRIHMELHQFSSNFIRKQLFNDELEMQLKTSQLLVDFQQQCVFLVNVNIF